MYSNNKTVTLLVAMLKEKEIKDIVISAGNSHDAIVRSIEEDGFFNTYNIVDERSAAFFAIGLIQEKRKPVAICCTSGTAASNYLTGVTEAFYRHLPLIVITADKHQYYLNQNEEQQINQPAIFQPVVKYQCTLPDMDARHDWWYANRILNEAFLEMDHHGTGPIHINVPIEYGFYAIDNTFTTNNLPKPHIINRFDRYSEEKIQSVFEGASEKKILVICGQDNHIDKKKNELIGEISKKYNVVFAADKLSNLHCEGTVEIARPWLRNNSLEDLDFLLPDIIISIDGNSVLDIIRKLKTYEKGEHWSVTEAGKVIDQYRKLKNIFEMPTIEFLEYMNRWGKERSNTYLETWKKEKEAVILPDFEYSNLYATRRLMETIPSKAILNLSNSTTIRLAQFFDLKESVEVYCNRGVNGIDGCMSAFIGQSSVTKSLSYLIIGDLAFFYDMNALWNRYIGNNIRIMLVNNGGAALFHFNQGLKKYPTLNENVAAEHSTKAKEWAESQGLQYISANNKKEFDDALKAFHNSELGHPVLLEVFTKKEVDAELQHKFYDSVMILENRRKTQKKMYALAETVLGQKNADKLKHKILGY